MAGAAEIHEKELAWRGDRLPVILFKHPPPAYREVNLVQAQIRVPDQVGCAAGLHGSRLQTQDGDRTDFSLMDVAAKAAAGGADLVGRESIGDYMLPVVRSRFGWLVLCPEPIGHGQARDRR